jgi:isopenicillin N synthase-like dioxygenase
VPARRCKDGPGGLTVARSLASVRVMVEVLDIAPFFTGDAAARGRVVTRAEQALGALGCLTITGHGVPDTVIDEADRRWRGFFDAPLAYKRAHMPADPGIFRGYYPMTALDTTQSADQPRPPDLREGFLVNRVDPLPAEHGPVAEYVAHANIWPDGEPGLRAATEAYYREMTALAERLLQLFAVALALPQEFFRDKIDRHHSTFSAAHYFEPQGPARPGQLRCGVHCDYGSLTILHQDDAPGGLQIQTPDGTWLDVPPTPGGLVINLGDTMQAWTQGRWRSPPHRVVNPPADPGRSTRRQSLLFFHSPNFDAELEPIPSCVRPDAPVERPGMRIGEFILSRTTRINETSDS